MPHSHTNTSDMAQLSHSRTLRWGGPISPIKLGQIIKLVVLERCFEEHCDGSTSHKCPIWLLQCYKNHFTSSDLHNLNLGSNTIQILNKRWFTMIQSSFVLLPYDYIAPELKDLLPRWELMMNFQLSKSFVRTREGKVAVRCETHNVELPRREKQRYARGARYVGLSSFQVEQISPSNWCLMIHKLYLVTRVEHVQSMF